MFKILLTMLIVINVTTVAYGQNLSLNLWGGFATVGMSDVNKSFDDMEKSFDAMASGWTKSITKFKSGIIFGIDGMYEISPEILIGPRIAYMIVTPAKFEAKLFRQDIQRYAIFEQKIDLSMLPLMLGGFYAKEISDGLVLGGKIFVGVGLGFGKSKVRVENMEAGQVISFEMPFSGSGFMAEVLAYPQYKIGKDILLGLNFGYRFATIPKMETTKDVPEIDVKKGDEVKDLAGKTIKFDYSGLTIGLGIKFNF